MTDAAASPSAATTTTTTTVKVDPTPAVAPVVTITPPPTIELPASWRDNIPAILMVFVTGGFFGLLAMMSWHEVPAANKDMLNTAMGMVATGWTFAMKFFYDSNAGSRSKDGAIASLAAAAAPAPAKSGAAGP